MVNTPERREMPSGTGINKADPGVVINLFRNAAQCERQRRVRQAR